MRRLLLLLLLLAAPAAARAQFPAQPPCGGAFFFEPTVGSAGTVQFDQVTVPDLPSPTGAFTIEAWVLYRPAEGVTTWPDGFHTIAAFGEINQGSLPLLNVRYGQLELWNGSSRVSGGTVPLNAWTHVAYSWDGTTNRLFVNGVETASSTNVPTVAGSAFYIGYSRGNTGWRGLIDEVMVWNEARSADEIAADAVGLPGAAAGLYAYFKLDDIWYDVWTGKAFAKNEVDGDVWGALGWTTDYPTGAPAREYVRTPAPAGATVLSCRLQTPLGVAVRADGYLDITEAGTGHGDGSLLFYRPGSEGDPIRAVWNLASEPSPEGMPAGTHGLGYDAQGRVLVVQGEGSGPDAMTLLVIDPSRATDSTIVATHRVGDFVLAQGYAESNPYAVVLGPDDDFFVLDAAANALVRIEDETGAMNIVAAFDDIANPTPVGPPTTDAVPTGIAFDGTRFYVTVFTGFPFAEGTSRVYTVDAQNGTVTVFRDGLTTAIDVDLDPRDGVPVVLEFARSGEPGAFLPETGRVLKLYDGYTDTLATGLTMPTALAHGLDGTLYVTTLGGQLLRYPAGSTVDTEDPAGIPADFALEANYPNPFNPSTNVRYTLGTAQPVRLAAYDLLGRTVAVLEEGMRPAGAHAVTWDAAGLASGVYFVRLETPSGTATQRAVLMK